MSTVETIGSATRQAQGYPTQIWFPQKDKRSFALIHDRRDARVQPGIFFIPGNPARKLEENLLSLEVQDDEDGVRRRLRIPAALLWDFHGGPCTAQGEKYRKIGEGVMDLIYKRIEYEGSSSLLAPDRELYKGFYKEVYAGPFDRPLMSTSPEEARRFNLMDLRLLRR